MTVVAARLPAYIAVRESVRQLRDVVPSYGDTYRLSFLLNGSAICAYYDEAHFKLGHVVDEKGIDAVWGYLDVQSSEECL